MIFDHIKRFRMSRLVMGFFVLAFVCSVSLAGETIRVIRVIDGDTVVLQTGQRVRLLGINAPEIGYKGKVSEIGAKAAQKYLKSKVLNKNITLEIDIEYEDKYTRRLAHIFLENGLHINEDMLRRGLAVLSLHPPNLKYQTDLMLAQGYAEEEQVGLWLLEDYQLKPIRLVERSKRKKWGRYSATVRKVTLSKKGAKLWLTKESYIWVSSNSYPYFTNLKAYVGKTIEIRGWPRKWGKHWSIQVIHPSQMIVR
ncbi:MAG: hypothetical protein A6F70_01315 [Cycloclasticus sp. symbiont of Bathymodiolus heckerae]|nr:MAG: hypothetical protein A6F70_01315 [Cycloclasticus sp. symbiont of Bathymodiolus heckerae]